MHNVNTGRRMAVLTRVIRSRKRLLQKYICGIIQIDDGLQTTGPLWGQPAKNKCKKYFLKKQRPIILIDTLVK